MGTPPLTSVFSTIFLHLLLLATVTNCQIGTAYQDITTVPGYADLKPCVQSCFHQTGFCPNDLLGSKIGCRAHTDCKGSNWQATNDCYCRSDLQKAAQDYLTSCVEQKCTVGDVRIDESSAGGIYGRYCNEKGYTAAPASVSANPTKGGTTATGASGSTGPAETGSSSSADQTSPPPADESKKLSISAIVGIVVGALAGLTFFAIFVRMMLKWCGCVGRPPAPSHHVQQPPPLPYHHQQQQPSYPMNLYPEQTYWQQKPMGVESEVGPDDSISVVTPPPVAPTMVSNGRR
ncbi:unnamed protein product [Periconia digitata]|uniref:Extracellular membrane protein CFEM domain-containing protein n=1 Tax=Periconia digitata TaxID=1303443 RepID=A0A9W4XNI4_9PLEO|nr:unnamed protein product [Periconia digitata]